VVEATDLSNARAKSGFFMQTTLHVDLLQSLHRSMADQPRHGACSRPHGLNNGQPQQPGADSAPSSRSSLRGSSAALMANTHLERHQVVFCFNIDHWATTLRLRALTPQIVAGGPSSRTASARRRELDRAAAVTSGAITLARA